MRPDIKLKNKSGIYCIKNTINNKVYIGRTKCFYRRCHQYLYDFKSRSIGHLNDYLFNSLRKYGIENFTFTVVEYCTLDQIQEKELFWIKSFESTVSKKGYNLRLDVNGSMKTDGRTSDKISKRLKREWSQGVRKDHSLKLRMSWKKGTDRNSVSYSPKL